MLDRNKAVVTGSAGFIGSHIVDRLIDRGYDVTGIDDLSAGKTDNLNPCAQFIQADVSNYVDILPHFKDVDVVFHNAASKKTVCLADPCRDMEVNGVGTLNVLKAMVEHGCNRIVHASTGSVYGEAKQYPTTEEHPRNPTSYYGISKLAGEQYVRVFGDVHDIDWTILRYHHVFGPRQDYSPVGGVVSIFINHLLNDEIITVFGDGMQERLFTFVDGVVDANMFVECKPECFREIYNVASGKTTTINELIYLLSDLLDVRPKIEYDAETIGDIHKFDVDNSKLVDLGHFGYSDLMHGLKKTIDWMKKEKQRRE
jgi:UDP-glucose 4-epimerase